MKIDALPTFAQLFAHLNVPQRKPDSIVHWLPGMIKRY